MLLEPIETCETAEAAAAAIVEYEKAGKTFRVWTDNIPTGKNKFKTAIYVVWKPEDFDKRKNEIVERDPKPLSDYFCFSCATRGKAGIMRYQGIEEGCVSVLKEEFDESALDGYRQSDREIAIDVYTWECDNCGKKDEDTLRY